MVHDIPVDFKGGAPTKTVVSDFAFVSDEEQSILVLGASSNNDIVLVDLKDNFKMRNLAISNSKEMTGGGKHNIEWAVGSNYVWFDEGGTQEQYIIDILGNNINEAVFLITLANITAGQMLFVNTYERERVANLIKSAIQSMKASDDSHDSHDSHDEVSTSGVCTKSTTSDNQSNDPTDVGVAALVIRCLTLLLGITLRTPEQNGDNKTLGSKRVA